MPTLDDLDAAFADLESRAPVPGAVGPAPVRAAPPRRARAATMLLSAAAVVALTVGDNEASAGVLERLGFTSWGREPAFCERGDGSLDDARHWALLTPDSR